MGKVPGRSRVHVSAGHASHGLLSARYTGKAMATGLIDNEWDLPAQSA
ncbi:hypothetical protein [Lentzea sp. NBRC 105346]|nr:hypothetical protein [Lentzea sp. NBRC 105346]